MPGVGRGHCPLDYLRQPAVSMEDQNGQQEQDNKQKSFQTDMERDCCVDDSLGYD